MKPRPLALLALLALLLGGKLAVASHLPLFGDEAFYWQCSQRLAFAYADHPPLTALLVRLGVEVAGDSTLGVRLGFILLGTLFPLVVYHLARPLVGPRDAYWAAFASLALPGFAAIGIVAVPDAPLTFLTALYLLAFERATRRGRLGWWLVAGAVGALGLATHYRFVLAPAAAVVFVLTLGRKHLREPGWWASLGLLGLGLLPSVVFNLQTDFAPVRYYLAGRHGLAVRPEAIWKLVATQAGLTTPLLFVGLLWALGALVRRARTGDDRAGLLASFALVPLITFTLFAPFERSGLATGHWPLPAYVPLLVALPATARAFLRAARAAGWLRLPRAVVALAPTIGLVTLLVLGLELGTGRLKLGALRKPFVGWREVADLTQRRLAGLAGARTGDWLVVADNYKLGANLAFESGRALSPFVLDHPKNHSHGRALQLPLWGIDERALREQAGKNALVVIQVKELRSAQRPVWRAHINGLFERVEPVAEVRFIVGRRTLTFVLLAGYSLR